jgi:hypothetical protein
MRRAGAVRHHPRRCSVSDLLYLGLVVGFFGLSWAFVELCERV